MKKNKKIQAFTASALTTCFLTGCNMLPFSPSDNNEPDVYGPPPEEIFDEEEERFNPEDNNEPDVYGPPREEIFDEEETFNPSDNTPPPVYGPPPENNHNYSKPIPPTAKHDFKK